MAVTPDPPLDDALVQIAERKQADDEAMESLAVVLGFAIRRSWQVFLTKRGRDRLRALGRL